jgi:hypothetical protein
MLIIFQTLSGKEASVELEETALVEDLRALVTDQLVVPIETVDLIFRSSVLTDKMPLSSLRLTPTDRIFHFVVVQSTPWSSGSVSCGFTSLEGLTVRSHG